MAGPINVRVVRYPAILRGKILLQPEINDALNTIGTRLERKGKGLGERRNQTNRTRGNLMERFDIELSHFPRRTGWSKKAKMRKTFYSMAPNVIRKMSERIAARWAS